MTPIQSRKVSGLMAALMLVAAPVGAVSVLSIAMPAHADVAAAKAAVDGAKARGVVGEQGDGFIGFVGATDPDLVAAVTAINSGRAEVYSATAAKTGVTPDAAGQAVAVQLFSRLPAGQYYKPLGGAWARK
jgi:uncharacterized protein YdbL (DUF1318 family)